MSTPVQASAVPLLISFDGGVTFKTLVCIESYTIDSVTQTTTSDTFCGRFIGLGPIASTISGSAVCETTPVAGQCTQKDLQGAQQAQTLLFFRANYPTAGSMGGQISNNASGYCTNVGEQFAINNLIKFTYSFLINGSLS
jgi:hypothetical protein